MYGIYKYTFGTPEAITPVKAYGGRLDESRAAALPDGGAVPFLPGDIGFTVRARGCTLTLPARDGEQFFGLGLQLKSVAQRGKKKTLRVNSDPITDMGDSHAPVPFYVSTAGYGVYIDTARYASFYFCTHVTDTSAHEPEVTEQATDTDTLYAARQLSGRQHVLIDIPAAKGADIYIFTGPTMADAVRRYNMYSGGGALPAMWGLGVWYRTWSNSVQDNVIRQAKEIRADGMPCDVFGLEPGWQTRAYSCSYVWSEERFPDHCRMIDTLAEDGFKMNLWEHVFVHPESPVYSEVAPGSGDYRVWNGAVPDFMIPQTRRAFADYHKKTFIDEGISGFKLDENDNSDYISSPWSFPEATQFPSGADGEQMHSMLGMLFQETMLPTFTAADKRTYNSVRSSGAFAAPMPFVLYSDLYDLSDFIRGTVTMGFSGLLWTPEVRQCGSEEELLRRLEATVFSPMALLNCWMLPNPVWKQYDYDKNCAGKLSEDGGALESKVRELFELRMSLLPYIYSAFARYATDGTPPFRALVLDYPEDGATHSIDNELLVGGDLLFAPLLCGQSSREVYFPAGIWHGFFTGEKYSGGEKHTVAYTGKPLLFVRDNSLIPFAAPVECVRSDTVFDIELRRFGSGESSCCLYEDDGESYAYREGKFNTVTAVCDSEGRLTVIRKGQYPGVRYHFTFNGDVPEVL